MKNKKTKILIAILVILIIVLGIVLAVKIFEDNKELSEDVVAETNEIQEEIPEEKKVIV